MSRHLTRLIIALALASAAVLLANYIFVHRALASVLDEDPRNKGVVAFAHYDYFVMPSTIVLDLRSVAETNSPADIFRVLLQFSATQKNHEFETVKLSFRGEPKFLLKGTYFKTLGIEHDTQNPVYTMRTLPENLYHPDGTEAFGRWTGGLLGVLGKQMEDFMEFHSQWYITDLTKTGG